MDKQIQEKVIELITLCEAKGASFVVGIAHDGGVHQAMGGEAIECVALLRILTELAEERRESEAGSAPKPSRPN